MEVIDLTDESQEPRTAPVVRVKPIGIEHSIDVVDLLDEEENPGRHVPALPATGASPILPPSRDGEISGVADERLRKGSKTKGERRYDDFEKNTTENPPVFGRQSIQTTHPQLSTSMMAEVIDISSDESEADIETGHGSSIDNQTSNSGLDQKVFHRETSLEQAAFKPKPSRDQGKGMRVRDRRLEHCSTLGDGVHLSPANRRSEGKGCNSEPHPIANSSKTTQRPQQGPDAKSGSTSKEAEFEVQSWNALSHEESTDKARTLPIANPNDDMTSDKKSDVMQSDGNDIDPPPIPHCIDAIISEPLQRGPANPLVKELSPAVETVRLGRNDIGVEDAVRTRQKSVSRVDKRSVTKRRRTIDLDSADDKPPCKIAGVRVREPPLNAKPSRGSVQTKNASLRQNNGDSASNDVARSGGIQVGETPTPCMRSRVPNFILIDDSSDEESASVQRLCRKQIRSIQRTQACNHTFQKGLLPPHKEILDKKFRPGADFNFDKSMKEALEEQEGLFRQAAASLHLHEEFLRNLRRPRHQRDSPIFTRAVDPSRLHQDHWKWQCAYARLGLPMHASDSIVKKQYRKHALKYHPDKCRLDDASTRFQAVTEAFNKIRQRA